jgi:rubrerythrin
MDNRRERRIDRRSLLRGAVATAGAGAVGGLAGGGLPGEGVAPAAPARPSDADAATLRSALEVELLVAFVYRRLLTGGTLGPAARALATAVLEHELVHVRTLSTALERLGRSLPGPPVTVAEADRQLSAHHSSGSLAAVHREIGALDLLYDVEAISIGAYSEALKRLNDPVLMRLAVEIMGAEAQHASAIGGLLHPGKWDRVVPVGSVEGRH